MLILLKVNFCGIFLVKEVWVYDIGSMSNKSNNIVNGKLYNFISFRMEEKISIEIFENIENYI